jgi:hypothetical protein
VSVSFVDEKDSNPNEPATLDLLEIKTKTNGLAAYEIIANDAEWGMHSP